MMSGKPERLNLAIFEFMKENRIVRGSECPVLRVSLAGYDANGDPLFTIRPATEMDVKKAVTGNINSLED